MSGHRPWSAPGWQGEAGVGRVDITPPEGIRARDWGPSTVDCATGVHRPLTMTALVLRSDIDAPLRVLITADLGWWRRTEDEWHVRGAVVEKFGLDVADVMIHLVHTHAGPSICPADVDLPGGALVPGYLDQLRHAAINAVGTAVASLGPATMTTGIGRCAVAACRDLPHGNRFVVGYHPGGTADDTLLATRINRPDGDIVATLVNYACHPTTLGWDNTLISPDFVGAARQIVEEATGRAPCLFLQGASGDLAPREQYTGDTEVADRHGRAIGHAAMSVIDTLPGAGQQLVLDRIVESGAPLAWWRPAPATWAPATASTFDELQVRAQRLPPLHELEERWADIDPSVRAVRLQRAERLRATYQDLATVTHPVWIWRIGEVIIVGHPGEAFSVFQQTLRTQFPDNPIVVLNLVNGPGWVYLPPSDFYENDAYQVWQTTVGAGTLEQLVEHCIRRIQELLTVDVHSL